MFRPLVRTTAGIGGGYRVLDDAIKGGDQSQINEARKRAKEAAEKLEGLDWEIEAAFPYATVWADIHEIKEARTKLADAVEGQVPEKDYVEASRRFIKSATLTHRRLEREMEMLSEKQYRQAVEWIERAFDENEDSERAV